MTALSVGDACTLSRTATTSPGADAVSAGAGRSMLQATAPASSRKARRESYPERVMTPMEGQFRAVVAIS